MQPAHRAPESGISSNQVRHQSAIYQPGADEVSVLACRQFSHASVLATYAWQETRQVLEYRLPNPRWDKRSYCWGRTEKAARSLEVQRFRRCMPWLVTALIVEPKSAEYGERVVKGWRTARHRLRFEAVKTTVSVAENRSRWLSHSGLRAKGWTTVPGKSPVPLGARSLRN